MVTMAKDKSHIENDQKISNNYDELNDEYNKQSSTVKSYPDIKSQIMYKMNELLINIYRG